MNSDEPQSDESQPLGEFERRVLGSLLEKSMAQPDYYPMTEKALVAACNQKQNREPVMSLDTDAVWETLQMLRERGLLGLPLVSFFARFLGATRRPATGRSASCAIRRRARRRAADTGLSPSSSSSAAGAEGGVGDGAAARRLSSGAAALALATILANRAARFCALARTAAATPL